MSRNFNTEFMIESDKKQRQFEIELDSIVTALESCGHKGWWVEHVIDPDQNTRNNGLKTYYGSATFRCDKEMFSIHIYMSTSKSVCAVKKAHLSISHGELEKYYNINRDTIRAGLSFSKDPQLIAREIIRRLIIPARGQRPQLVARQTEEIQRLTKVHTACGRLIKATDGKLTVETDADRMRDKNAGAELKYYVHSKIDVKGKVGHYGNYVDLSFEDLTVEQAEDLLAYMSRTVPARTDQNKRVSGMIIDLYQS